MADSDGSVKEIIVQTCEVNCLNLDDDNFEQYNDPKWWPKAVAEGNVEELRRGVSAKPSGLCWLDKTGRTLLHVAASCNSVEVIHLLASLKFDLDAQDEQGKTALHEAVQHDKINAIHALIEAGAKCNIPHNGGLSVLLYAVDANRPLSLDALLSHTNALNIQETDASGSTALHFAAGKNCTECIAVLLKYDALPCATNNAGLCSANVAAYAGSANALRAFCVWAEGKKLEVAKFMNMSDTEGNLLLHAAVDSGSLDTVKVCLEYGALIDSQQEDQSTPVHFAAMRGELEIIRVMFAAQPAHKKGALCLTDKSGMTVLHKAVLFDNVAVAQFFLDEGAEVDAADVNEQTALLLAASKQSRKCVKLLLERGANSAHVDKDGRNFVHLVVLSGANLENFMSECILSKIQNFRELLNQKDYFGCTPLHYASIEGQLGTTENLLNFGAGLHEKTHSKTTALHFAAKYGRFNTCKKLLDCPYGSHIINATDSLGCTALHHAAKYGNAKVVQLLLERGAIFHRAYCGNSPFSLAAFGGHIKVMKLMLTFNKSLMDMCCKRGYTALHISGSYGHSHATDFLLTEGAAIKLNEDGCTFFDLAVKKQNKDVCTVAIKHDRWREILSFSSPTYPSPIFGLIEELPEVCMQVLNRCITNNNVSARSKEYAITYDFTFLELNKPKKDKYKSDSLDWNSLDRPLTASSGSKMLGSNMGSTASLMKSDKNVDVKADQESFKDIIKTPLPVIQHMLKFGRVELLVSPLCTEYMNTKWIRYARFIATKNVIEHLFAVIVLAITVWLCPQSVQCYLTINNNCDWANKTCVQSFSQTPACATPLMLQICTILILVYASLRIPLLFLFFLSLKARFFLDLGQVLNLLTAVLLMAYAIPSLLSSGTVVSSGIQWNLLAIATASEYFAFVLEMRILSSLGLYIVMFIEILKTLFKSCLTFVFLVIGFALAFTVLYQVPITDSSEYDTYVGALSYNYPLVSILRTLVMTTGELEFFESISRALTNPSMQKGLPFPVSTIIMFGAFVILISIAMFNLIVGLAIGDIKVVRSGATLKRIEIQADFYSTMENFIYKSRLNKICKDPRPDSVTRFPNESGSKVSRLLHDIFSPPDSGASKATDQAIEAANRLYFQRSVTKQLEKEKERIKKMNSSMEKHMELTKLILDKLDIKWDSIQSHDEGLRSMKVVTDIKSIKSNSSANWDKLFMTLSNQGTNSSMDAENSDDDDPRSLESGRRASKAESRKSIWSIGHKRASIGIAMNTKL